MHGTTPCSVDFLSEIERYDFGVNQTSGNRTGIHSSQLPMMLFPLIRWKLFCNLAKAVFKHMVTGTLFDITP